MRFPKPVFLSRETADNFIGHGDDPFSVGRENNIRFLDS